MHDVHTGMRIHRSQQVKRRLYEHMIRIYIDTGMEMHM